MTRLTLRAGGYQGPQSVHTRALTVLVQAIDRLSGGEITLAVESDVTAAGRLATDLLADVEGGRLDLCYFASSYLVARVPALALFELPFASQGRAATLAKVDGESGAMIAAAVADTTGFAVAGYWDNGLRHVSTRARPITGPADAAGLTIRTIDSPLQRDAFRAIGFTPVTVDVKDLVQAVATGRVEAQENPLTNTVNFGLHRTHRFHSLTGHVHGLALVLLSRARAPHWPTEVRAILDQAIDEATAAQRRLAAEEDTRCLAILAESGAAVLDETGLDMEGFRRATQAVREREIARLDPALAAAWNRA